MKIRLATFNVENLFARFDFSAFSEEQDRRYLPPIVNFFSELEGSDESQFEAFKTMLSAARIAQEDDKRQHTALALTEADADLVCLQEIDNIEALARFRDFYIHKASGRRYKQLILHEGNDFRGIDVAAMATEEIPLYSRSHAWRRVSHLGTADERADLADEYPKAKSILTKKAGDRIFRRDCLELEVRDGDSRLTVFVCHFKSMSGGRSNSIGVRQVEALGVKQIIEEKFEDPAVAHWLIVGDLNDYRRYVLVSKTVNADGSQNETVKELDDDDPSGLDPLLDDGFAINLVERRAVDDQWTHYFTGDRHKTQLDYMLASPALAASFAEAPTIIRAGQPLRVPNTDGDKRYPRVGWDRPKASDHCPVVIEFELPA